MSDNFTNETLFQVICESVEHIAHTLEPDGDWMQMAFVVNQHDQFQIIGLPAFEEDGNAGKDALADWLTDRAKAVKAKAVATVATAWMVTKPIAELATVGRPALDPQRQEVVIVSVVSPAGATARFAAIQRREADAPLLSHWHEMGGAMQGRWADRLLPALRSGWN